MALLRAYMAFAASAVVFGSAWIGGDKLFSGGGDEGSAARAPAAVVEDTLPPERRPDTPPRPPRKAMRPDLRAREPVRVLEEFLDAVSDGGSMDDGREDGADERAKQYVVRWPNSPAEQRRAADVSGLTPALLLASGGVVLDAAGEPLDTRAKLAGRGLSTEFIRPPRGPCADGLRRELDPAGRAPTATVVLMLSLTQAASLRLLEPERGEDVLYLVADPDRGIRLDEVRR